MDQESALIRAVLADPGTALPRQIYADWLDERGDRRGEYLRLVCDLDMCRCSDDEAENARERIRELQATIDPFWLAQMNRGRKQPQRRRSEQRPLTTRERQRLRVAFSGDRTLFQRRFFDRWPEAYHRAYSAEIEDLIRRMTAKDLKIIMCAEEAVNSIPPRDNDAR
jgi:uncharacterized protein (TIGR02996 family)